MRGIFRAPNFFRGEFQKAGKPTGKRGYEYQAYTFEDVLLFILDEISMRDYQVEYWYAMLGEHIFIESVQESRATCEYRIKTLDHHTKKLVGEYEVLIDCIHDSDTVDVMERSRTFVETQPVHKQAPRKKRKAFAKWVLQEDRAVKLFLMRLAQKKGDLAALKKELSKATYYRVLKRCEEKGHIVNGKLVRDVYTD